MYAYIPPFLNQAPKKLSYEQAAWLLTKVDGSYCNEDYGDSCDEEEAHDAEVALDLCHKAKILESYDTMMMKKVHSYYVNLRKVEQVLIMELDVQRW
jgi:hypothetical protein